jgi:hypothetical protein
MLPAVSHFLHSVPVILTPAKTLRYHALGTCLISGTELASFPFTGQQE